MVGLLDEMGRDVVDFTTSWGFVTSMGHVFGIAVDEVCEDEDKDGFDQDAKLSFEHSFGFAVCEREGWQVN